MMQNKEETITEKEWVHAGLKCKVNFYKTPASGHNWRCGYVILPETHLCYKMSYDDIPVEVHGGLTYSTELKDGSWMIGFDCIHAGDRTEGDSEERGHFWLLDEVVKETNRLAEQLAKVTIDDCFVGKIEYMPEWFKSYLKQHLIKSKQQLVK